MAEGVVEGAADVFHVRVLRRGEGEGAQVDGAGRDELGGDLVGGGGVVEEEGVERVLEELGAERGGVHGEEARLEEAVPGERQREEKGGRN